MRNFNLVSGLILVSVGLLSVTGCRTPGGKPTGNLKQATNVACDAKGLLPVLSPGGLFATKRVLYNQPRVDKDWIHPVMAEKSSPSDLGLFHNFIPKESESKKIKKITAALATLVKDVSAAKSNAPKVKADAAEFVGKSDVVNVFKIDGEALLQIKQIKFDVPKTSSIIVLVTGSTPAFKSAALSGDVDPDKLLFVLPEAGTFRVQGEKFFGTVIAPEAAVFMESSFDGSIYAGEISVREPMTRSFYSGCLTSDKM